MQLNGVTLVDRHNRPALDAKVAIRALFMNDGSFVDPYDVSSCTIFARTSNLTPSSVVDDDDSLISSDASTVVLMNFGVSGNPANNLQHDGVHPRVTSQYSGWVSPTETSLNGGTSFYTNGYFQHTQASGIYRNGVGDFVCVLDGGIALSGGYDNRVGYREGFTVANAASSVQEYIDVWTVKMAQDSEYQLFINTFTLFNDTFTAITEPLLLTTRNKLINKKLQVGDVVDMKVTTGITIQNKNLDDATKNIIKDYSLQNAQVQIKKINEDSVNQQAWESVVPTGTDSFEDASFVTSDNTIVYNFNTASLDPGTYFMVVKYQFMTQTFVSPKFYFTIT